ncbi:hypothetical protein M703_01830 [Neisseria gonorrhoeae SK29344]|nr:hypothetical protein M703_01830 [Neisseria gonorrhoeae SK29344]KLS36697.1 hypothetical protein M724_06210 [Neisseria gonorrhoeae ATL_2011_01_05]KLS58074.1 hypothetical protein M743_04485 [Neisseria gonorrhoeae NYC_2011_05_13]KLS79545.1 hypothetical protein M786_07140 [Neisseria gonorrhoeae MU_NG21]
MQAFSLYFPISRFTGARGRQNPAHPPPLGAKVSNFQKNQSNIL